MAHESTPPTCGQSQSPKKGPAITDRGVAGQTSHASRGCVLHVSSRSRPSLTDLIKCHRPGAAKLLRIPADIGCSLRAAPTSSFPVRAMPLHVRSGNIAESVISTNAFRLYIV